MDFEKVQSIAREFDSVIEKNLKEFLERPNLEGFKTRYFELAHAALAIYTHTLVSGLAMCHSEEDAKMTEEFRQLQEKMMLASINRSNILTKSINEFISKTK